MPLVSVFMDVEDVINLRSDDAALYVLQAFERAGVRGSFCITGAKCRSLMSRGRTDVLAHMEPHCLGLHTDTHSEHPTTMELLADVDYEEGCRLALETERKGFESFVSAFDRTPAFWGGAGNTWSCEISYALRELGIPAYAYALTAISDEGVHRFNGCFALPQHLSISEPEWADDAKSVEAGERVLARLAESKVPWIGVFVGHPTKLRHKEYWDTPFFHGRTPPEPEPTEPLPAEVFARSIRNLEFFLGRLKADFEVVGVDALLARVWQTRKPINEEMEHFDRKTPDHIRAAAKWPVHRPGLDPENMVRKAMALRDTVEACELRA